MVYLIIPAYNEEKNLGALIPRIDGNLRIAGIAYTLIVVNDGSRDATRSVAAGLAAGYPLEIVDHPVNKGVGAVFHTGLREACARAADDDVLVILEADGTNDPALIPEMARRIAAGRCDVVIGSRYQRGGRYYKFPLKRLILSYGANLIFRLLYPMPQVRDYTIFFRAYRAGTIKEAFRTYGDEFISEKTFACNAAMLVKLRKLGVRVEEVPLVYRYDLKKGRSKMRVRATISEYIDFIARQFRIRR